MDLYQNTSILFHLPKTLITLKARSSRSWFSPGTFEVAWLQYPVSAVLLGLHWTWSPKYISIPKSSNTSNQMTGDVL